MVRVALVIVVLGCHHDSPRTTIANTASVNRVPRPAPDAIERARVLLSRAQTLAVMGAYLQAYAAAQRGLNVLDGDPDIDNGAVLEVSTTQASADELVFMTQMRTRELERRISKR